jgi:hypothetical protein
MPDDSSSSSKKPARKMPSPDGKSASVVDPLSAWQTSHLGDAARIRNR